MRATSSILSLACSGFVASAAAIHIPFHRKHLPSPPVSHFVDVRKRTSSSVDQLARFDNFNNTRYVGEVTLSGQSFEVILDTGSHDMWLSLSTSLPHYTNSSLTATIDYGAGTGTSSSVSGPVLITEMQFANFTVPSQAFIAARDASAFIEKGVNGLMGLSPPTAGGEINAAFKQGGYTSANGTSPLDNIFSQNQNVTPMFTMLMSRNDGTEDSSGGVFTIGEPLPQYTNVTAQPVLPIVNTTDGRQHWTLPLDGMKVNGKWYNTSLSGQHNLTAVLDTGTPLTSIDSALVEDIYGAYTSLIDDGLASLVSCDTMINVSFVFGGVEFPVNPLDTVIPSGRYQNGSVGCVGAFVRSQSAPGNGNLLLGDTFLRNVYALYNLNWWGKDGNTTLPYVQLLSMTNAEEAAAQFSSQNTARLNAFNNAYPTSAAWCTRTPPGWYIAIFMIMGCLSVITF